MSVIDDLTKNAVKVGQGFFSDANKQAQAALHHVAGPIPEAHICDAEKQLNVTFPDEYRSFIAAHGAFLGNGLELYGLTSEEDEELGFFCNVVQQTKLLRTTPNTDVDQRYITISSDGMGVDFLIDSATREGLLIVAYGTGFDFVEVANSLDEFCRNMLTDTYATLLNEVVS